jgi:hypothetical protein
VFHKRIPDPTFGSTYYLSPAVMDEKEYVYPKWAQEFIHVITIDNHQFYKPPARKKSV